MGRYCPSFDWFFSFLASEVPMVRNVEPQQSQMIPVELSLPVKNVIIAAT